MLNISKLKSLATGLEEITDTERQVRLADGYDAVIEVITSLSQIRFPVLVLEDRTSGVLTCIPGGMDTYTLALWVMCLAGRDDSKAQTYSKALSIIKRLIGLMLEQPSGLEGLDLSHMEYNKRSGGPNCYGYELLLTFNETIALSND